MQPQLAGQHGAGRSPADDDHIDHDARPPSTRVPVQASDSAAYPGSCRKPGGVSYIGSGGDFSGSPPFLVPHGSGFGSSRGARQSRSLSACGCAQLRRLGNRGAAWTGLALGGSGWRAAAPEPSVRPVLRIVAYSRPAIPVAPEAGSLPAVDPPFPCVEGSGVKLCSSADFDRVSVAHKNYGDMSIVS